MGCGIHFYTEWNPDRDTSLLNLCRKAIRRRAKESPESQEVLARALSFASPLPEDLKAYLRDDDPRKNEFFQVVTPGGAECEVEDQGDEDYPNGIIQIPQFGVKQCYDVFGVLGGVRSWPDVVPIAPFRGVPNNCCPEIHRCYSETGEHSESYVYAHEILDWKRVKRRPRKPGQFHLDDRRPTETEQEKAYKSLVKLVKVVLEETGEQDPRRIRFVFWFDS